MKTNNTRKQSFIEAFRKATQEHTHVCSIWDWNKIGGGGMVEIDHPYPIPGGKYTIDENFGRNQICIRCKRCWTDDLLAVAKKIAPKFRARVSGYLCMGGFGTAYNFFTIRLP